MREEDAVRALETLGLTGKEAAAYLNLHRSGASSAQQVSVHLGVQYPAVYRILQSLQSKGWVEVSQDRPNRYRARAPRIVAEEARQARGDDRGGAVPPAGAVAHGLQPEGGDVGRDQTAEDDGDRLAQPGGGRQLEA